VTKPSVLRNAVLVGAFAALCVVGMEFLAVNIGQGNPFGSSYEVQAVFADAEGIPTTADVRVDGVDVGRVVSISHDASTPGETVVTLAITDPSATPVYTNGSATVRQKTLLGDEYIDLTVGNGFSADAIPSGGSLPVSQAGADVSTDQIFDTFDAPTRAEEQQVIADLDAGTFQRSGDLQDILPQLTTVISNLEPVAAVYEKDQPQVDDIFVQLNTIMQTLANEHVQIAGLLHDGNIALSAIAARDQALISTLQEAADFETEVNNAVAPAEVPERAAIQVLDSSLQKTITLLDEVAGPQAACGGKPCGIDQILTGTLVGDLSYPNDQLTITTSPGELVADEWDSMFSQPQTDNRGLNYVISIHLNNP
jgi:phospholipid/cholesterol/gamma-HCH transport system substrate-binding protein